mmetsp:Transcript_49174/g.91093  ORF Transcript_49174/g.91093 Transcript_49174/m.91093 type:complete len:216 (-) Transcript_49174:1660-2307(-)
MNDTNDPTAQAARGRTFFMHPGNPCTGGRYCSSCRSSSPAPSPNSTPTAGRRRRTLPSHRACQGSRLSTRSSDRRRLRWCRWLRMGQRQPEWPELLSFEAQSGSAIVVAPAVPVIGSAFEAPPAATQSAAGIAASAESRHRPRRSRTGRTCRRSTPYSGSRSPHHGSNCPSRSLPRIPPDYHPRQWCWGRKSAQGLREDWACHRRTDCPPCHPMR